MSNRGSYSAKELSQRLRKSRLANGYTQSDLAKKTGLQPSAISHFEREGSTGRTPCVENLCLLANATGVSIDYLLCAREELTSKAVEDLGNPKTFCC